MSAVSLLRRLRQQEDEEVLPEAGVEAEEDEVSAAQ